MNNPTSSSDFLSNHIPLPKQETFFNVKEIYASPTGFTRLLHGDRYGKQHILKTLQDFYNHQPFFEQALRKEFNIGYQLEHPNICRTLGWENVTDIGQCIVMEYIDGVTLKELIEQKRLTPDLAVKIITELCEALDYLHKKQIVHRDLKPVNILVTHNGNNVKLIDFGLSDSDDYDVLKIPAGTRYYLAPEAMLPEVQLDIRSDIYSIGVIIGEMATVLNNKQMARISRKCTRRNPKSRYQSTTEISKALTQKKRPLYYVLVPVLIALIGLFAYGAYNSAYYQTPHPSSYPTYGNSVTINRIFREVLAKEKNRIKQKGSYSKNDSIEFFRQLQIIMDEQYPLSVQKNSLAYRRQWELIQLEASRLFRPTDP